MQLAGSADVFTSLATDPSLQLRVDTKSAPCMCDATCPDPLIAHHFVQTGAEALGLNHAPRILPDDDEAVEVD